MIKINTIFFMFVLAFSYSVKGQEEAFCNKINSNIKFSVDTIGVSNKAFLNQDLLILDTRLEKEYKTSHLKKAIHTDFDRFSINDFQKKYPNKNKAILIYCSIGVRSEIIGEKLLKAGYKNVKNLYGGIFEWKNKNNPIFNQNNKTTDSVHTYSKEWSKWLTKGIKVYEK